jgi:hypothetical protein
MAGAEQWINHYLYGCTAYALRLIAKGERCSSATERIRA